MSKKDWNTLSSNAVDFERKLESLLSSYSNFASNHSSSKLNSDAWNTSVTKLESAINDSLNKLEVLLQDLDNSAPTSGSSNAITTRTLERHSDLYEEYRTSFKKYQIKIGKLKDHNALMSGATISSGASSGQQLLMDERIHIDAALDEADFIVGQAFGIRNDLREQQASLVGTQSRMSGITNVFPSMHSLMRKIRKKKLRDQVILAIVASVCIILLLKYIFS